MSENGSLEKRSSTAQLLAVLYLAGYHDIEAMQKRHPSLKREDLEEELCKVRNALSPDRKEKEGSKEEEEEEDFQFARGPARPKKRGHCA